jgi:chromosome segregation ATPase
MTREACEPVAEVAEAGLPSALATAIANHAAAEQAHSKAASLVENLWERRASARSAVDAAKAALEEAKDAIVAGTGKASSLGAARHKLEAAELILSSLVQAEPGLKASLETAQRHLIDCKARLNAKVNQVVPASDSVRRVIEDFRITRATFVEKYQLMRSLALASMLPPEAGLWEASIEYEGVVNGPLPEPWRAALQALRSDANAALPD